MLTSFLTSTVGFVVVLGVLIFIHELGHFAVAKWSGVGVEKFSLGFGPKIFGVTKGETEYLVSLLPLGGYVKMTGESLEDAKDITDEERERSFTHKPLSKRVAIVSAGPIMNLVLAAILFPVIYMIGIQVPAYLDGPPLVGMVAPDDTAEEAGLKEGDLIVEIRGEPVKNFEQLFTTIAMSPEIPLPLKVNRSGEMLDMTLTPGVSKEHTGTGGFYPPMRPRVGSLVAGKPAEKAGMKPGDLILAIDGKSIKHWRELQNIVEINPEEMAFRLQRGEEYLTVRIKPEHIESDNIYRIGISPAEDTVLKRYGFFKSIDQGVGQGINMTVQLFGVLKGMIVGDYSFKTLGGPITIARVAGQAAEGGVSKLLTLMAFLSLQLGIINLFPIPVLDGGHLFFYGIEAIKGKPISERIMGISQQVGFVMLIMLMVLVTYNDIMRLFGWG